MADQHDPRYAERIFPAPAGPGIALPDRADPLRRRVLLHRRQRRHPHLRAEVSGHDVSIQSRDKGRFVRSVGVEIGKLAGSATA